MKGEPVLKAEFPAGSSDSVPASAAGREAMPGPVQGDEVAGKASPSVWLHKALKPLEPPAGVSAGRTFAAPFLIAARKPSSHRRGALRGKNKPRGEKESLESNDIWKQIVEELRKVNEMKGEPVLKAAFPAGSSDSVPASAAGREAMPGPVQGDEVARKASPLDWLNKVLKPLEPPADASAGRTFQAPLLVPAHKPSSHRRGARRGKNKPRGEKESLESNDIWKQIVEELHKGNEMDIEVLWKAAFPEGSSRSSLPAPAAGRKAKPDTGTGTGDWDTGKASPLTWRFEILKPTEGSAVTDVTAGKTSLALGLHAAHQPSSHHRGKPKHTTDKKFQKPFEVMRQMLKEMLRGGQEVDGEAVLKAAFPIGSSDSVPASAAGREAMPGTVTGDWNRDMDYLEALLENGLEFLEDAGAEPVAEGDLASQTTSMTEPLGDGEGVAAGRSSPSARVDSWHQPSSHRSGPPKGKTHGTAAKTSLDSNEFLRQTQKEAQHGQVMDQKSVQKEPHPGGRSGLVSGSTAGTNVMPSTGEGTEGAAGPTTRVPDSQKGPGRGFCKGTGCWLGLLAGLLVLELIFMFSCFGIWHSWKRNRSTSGQELKDRGCASHPEILIGSSSNKKGLGSPLKSSEKRTPEQPSMRKPPRPL
ncbi:uncharacterized protein LOC129124753 [Agelaius phoeniceus]|uniref:uncharacterized protein LOC129124753 n=1 Tax=Agelaius phoeniceus TaxID=39638 RepID=UPI004054D2CD